MMTNLLSDRRAIAGFGALLLCLAARSAVAQAPAKTGPPIRVAILLYDGVQVLDVAGPLEVLTSASMEQKAFDVYAVAEKLRPIRANNAGTVYLPRYTLATAPAPQILIVPGGDTAAAESNPRLVEWIRKTSQGTELTASVCTGAFLLAKAGLLTGKPATTHWYFLDRLAKEFPSVEVRREGRYVEAGNVLTSAGISAGIDMALHIVERYRGREAAVSTARIMQYESPDWKR
jgi:transcriptional regulator GlxA family with amidase domain